MNRDQARSFLMEGQHTAKLATVRSDGRPHVAPVWFLLDGDDVVFMTGAATVKGRNLRREPRVALTVDLEQPPYSFVLVEGTVTTSEDLDEMLPVSIRIAQRYVEPDRAEEFGRRNAVEGEMLVRLQVDKILGVSDLLA